MRARWQAERAQLQGSQATTPSATAEATADGHNNAQEAATTDHTNNPATKTGQRVTVRVTSVALGGRVSSERGLAQAQILFIDAGFSSGLPGGVVGGIKKATRP
jgi:hypothetical protein